MSKYFRKLNKELLAIVFTFVLFVFLVPPFQSPDEPAHLRYIEFLTEYRSLPSDYTYNNAELLNQSARIKEATDKYETAFISRNPNYRDQNGDFELTNNEPVVLHYIFNHPPLYYIWGAILLLIFGVESIVQALFVIRLFNLVFVLITYLYIKRFSSHLNISKTARKALVVMIMFWPMYLFISSGVNNDVLLTAASAATLTLAYEVSRSKKLNPVKILELALWVNIGLLTKAHFAPLLFYVAYVFIRRVSSKRIKASDLGLFLLGLLPSLLYFTTQILSFGKLYPAPILGANSSDVVVGTAYELTESCRNLPILNYLQVLVYPRLAMVAQNFVGNFGWLDTKVPLSIVLIFIASLLVALAGVLKELFLKSKGNEKSELAFILIPIIALESSFIYLYLKTYLPICYLYFPVQGRYYFPVLLPLMLLIVKGLGNVIPPNLRKWFYKSIIVLILLYLTYSVSLILQRYYL